jgi:hypothetical protein
VTDHLIQCDFCKSKIEGFQLSMPQGKNFDRMIMIILMISILLVLIVV